METTITATELAKSLSDVLNRVRYRGESFVIERGGRPVATLAPARSAVGITARDLVSRLRGHGLPGEGFADDLAAVQSAQPRVPVSPWRS